MEKYEYLEGGTASSEGNLCARQTVQVDQTFDAKPEDCRCSKYKTVNELENISERTRHADNKQQHC